MTAPDTAGPDLANRRRFTVAAVRQLVPAFHSLGDTRTPVIVSGLDLIDVMRMDHTLAQIPIVAMTASNLRPRGVPTLRKPFGVNGLIGAAKQYCESK